MPHAKDQKPRGFRSKPKVGAWRAPSVAQTMVPGQGRLGTCLGTLVFTLFTHTRQRVLKNLLFACVGVCTPLHPPWSSLQLRNIEIATSFRTYITHNVPWHPHYVSLHLKTPYKHPRAQLHAPAQWDITDQTVNHEDFGGHRRRVRGVLQRVSRPSGSPALHSAASFPAKVGVRHHSGLNT